MSRFFRDGFTSDTSSESSDEGDDDTGAAESSLSRADNSRALVQTSAVPGGGDQRDLLIHALLEERCLRQAQDELHEDASPSRVRAAASRRYRNLAQRLGRLNLVSAGLSASSFESARQRFRDGLDILGGDHADYHLESSAFQSPTLMNSMAELHRLSMDLNGLQLLGRAPRMPRMLTDNLVMPAASSVIDMRLESPHRHALTNTRYTRDFEEVAMLGRGGFGIVHHCRHRWDGLSYAIKRIPLSAGRLRNVQRRGQAEIDEMLLELTTLARLDHPNIVRYFSGWVELASLDRLSSPRLPGLSTSNPVSPSVSSIHQPSPYAVEQNSFITFEYSNPHQTSAGPGADNSRRSTSNNSAASRRNQEHLYRVPTHATVCEDDIETISRSASTKEDPLDPSPPRIDTSACLALHIQMGMYPLTLATLLGSETPNTKFCFHLEPAARLLSALIDGVEYLHEQGVVHRDLKPANIFLLEQASNTTTTWCRQCHAQEVCHLAYKLRIGDFGLVTAVTQPADVGPALVGTELYQPAEGHQKASLRALDWYAVGLIAFELIWPFSTRMERYETLAAIKASVYPTDFSARFGYAAGQITDLIESLLHASSTIDVDRLRAVLRSIYAQ